MDFDSDFDRNLWEDVDWLNAWDIHEEYVRIYQPERWRLIQILLKTSYNMAMEREE